MPAGNRENLLTSTSNPFDVVDHSLPMFKHSSFHEGLLAFANDEYDDLDFGYENTEEDTEDNPDPLPMPALQDNVLETHDNDTNSRQRTKRQAAPRWVPVPVVKNPFGHRYNRSETARNGKYTRIGINKPNRLLERTSVSKGDVYQFKLRDYRDNTIRKTEGRVSPPAAPGHLSDCKGRIELRSCFIKNTAPRLSPAQTAFKIAAFSYENDCDAVIPNGDTFAMAMEIKFTTTSKVIIQQLHGMPDRRLYRSGNKTYLIPENSDARVYRALKNIGAEFEQGGYPPESLAIKIAGGKPYLFMQVRADYAVFTDLTNRCNKNFKPDASDLNQAKCCHGERDVSTVYFGEIGVDLSRTGWNRFAFEIKSSDFSGSLVTPGHVKIWNNRKMVTHSITYIGRNDSPDRGGAGLHNKFGLYRPNSEEPATILFRHVRTGHVITDVDPGLRETLPPVTVNGTCHPLPAAPTTPPPSTTRPASTTWTTAVPTTIPSTTRSTPVPATSNATLPGPVTHSVNVTIPPSSTSTLQTGINGSTVVTDSLSTSRPSQNITELSNHQARLITILSITCASLGICIVAGTAVLCCLVRQQRLKLRPSTQHPTLVSFKSLADEINNAQDIEMQQLYPSA